MKWHHWVGIGSVVVGVIMVGAIAPGVSQHYPYYNNSFSWGQTGRDGRPGRDGRSGSSAQDQTIITDGTARTFDLKGGDGEPGTDGEYGEAARCSSYWRRPEHNIRGADGGDGGRGGNGGNGGDGADVTIFYQQPQDLSFIFIDNRGGEGGLEGRGGYGGRGCGCPYSSWVVETCRLEEVASNNPEEKPRKEERCTQQRYYCTPGRNGRNAPDGNPGRNGTPGTVTLIQNLTAIPTDNPNTTISLAALERSGTTLSKNIWRSPTGLRSKLASGSQVPDTYREYVELFTAPIQLVWAADQPQTAFNQAQFSLSLGDSRQLAVQQSGEAWLDYTVQPQGNGFQIQVNRAMQADEATQLIRQGLRGTGRDLTFSILDLGSRSDWLDTQFIVTYRTRNPTPQFREGYTYETRYSGCLSPEAVQQIGSEYQLRLGDLPLDQEYLQSGMVVDLEITAERRFGEHQTQQVIQWRGGLP
ncbi:hypothetical protein [Synechococcus sp. BDU 130192]|uniref:hypothetical protein n=1 Tax=Synechococcus sp. BDU 130192 TaxID=2042059 RepID=UPI000C08D3B6|nr:hypothetical protein [Synechococcus sp. BDU 130192]